MTLLDATRKKVAATRRMIAALGLDNASTRWGRAETVAHDDTQRERYDVVTARAVAPLSVLIEYTAGFVRVGGVCWYFKSSGAATSEIKAAAQAARACAMEHLESRTYRLPGAHGSRVLIAYTKTSDLRAELPRPPGSAARNPL